MVTADKIIFPNGIQKIFQIRFPNGEELGDMQLLECEGCKTEMIAGRLFDQHLEWAKEHLSYLYEPQSIEDFLYRECPYCKKIIRIHKKKAIGSTGGGFMPDAGDVMKLYLSGEEVAELAKGGEVIGTIVGPGEVTEFDDKNKKNADGTPVKIKKIQLCVSVGDGEERYWSPNSTTMRKCIAKWGQKTEDWEGHKVGLEALKQNVSGQMKLVVYGTPKD